MTSSGPLRSMANRPLVCTKIQAPAMFSAIRTPTTHRDAKDHRDAADELPEHVGRAGDGGQRNTGLREQPPDPAQAAAEVVLELGVRHHDHAEADPGEEEDEVPGCPDGGRVPADPGDVGGGHVPGPFSGSSRPGGSGWPVRAPAGTRCDRGRSAVTMASATAFGSSTWT